MNIVVFLFSLAIVIFMVIIAIAYTSHVDSDNDERHSKVRYQNMDEDKPYVDNSEFDYGHNVKYKSSDE